ncbi:hypothetical protein BDW74DRAFT_151417 [Aspergillus multicolor]|uniref:BRcat domain-containing protein n=1 Tax=Aspergillus multicolor TaxID=41759 RepID=UPI003CCD6002
MKASAVDGAPREAGRKSRRRLLSDCKACSIRSVNVTLLSCGHRYCPSCVAELFKQAIKDEAEFPTYCCRGETLEIDAVREFLDADLIEQYENKKAEYETPGRDRVYCCVPTCSEFIHPSLAKGNIAICPKCRARTCICCKSRAHLGKCSLDNELKELLQLEENG